MVQTMESKNLDSLMEKLRLKTNQFRSWSENAKSMRVALMDKRQIMDSADKCTLQKCLDTLQKSIKVTTLKSMVERLESITRQQGLKFTAGASGTECFISSDMVSVEVLLELEGAVKDIKIAHHGEQELSRYRMKSCQPLAEILRKGEFSQFISHLEGLVSIYQLNADMKQKSKAYLALKALETDLSMLSELQSSINEPNNLVHRSPVGILQKRIGGQPMKLTYFISPYDLLDIESNTSIPLTVESIKQKQLGRSVTVCIESCTVHKLQTMSLMTISKSDGKSLPQFAALSNLNSTTLPACFALRSPKPIPLSISLVKKIQSITGISFVDVQKAEPLLLLISQHASDGQLDCSNNKAMFVTLPDQHHCYFLNSGSDLNGVLVTSIPFVHPTQVPQILVFLRQQTLFNELIGSCIRTCSNQDLETAITFEIMALSWLHISISFEHPLDESMSTADLDLSDVTNVKCKLYSLSCDNSICSDEYASKVLQRCLSIPVTMRAVLKKAQTLQKKIMPPKSDLFYHAVSAGMNSSSRQRIVGSGNNDAMGRFSSQHGSSNGNKMMDNAEFNGHSNIDSNEISAYNSNMYVIGRVGGASSQQSNTVSDSIGCTGRPLNTSLQVQTSAANSTASVSGCEVQLLSPTTGHFHSVSLSNATASTTATLQQFSDSSMSSTTSEQNQGSGMLMNMLNDTNQNQPITMLLQPKSRKNKKRKVDGSSGKSPTGRSPKRKLSDDDYSKEITSDQRSGSTSPAGRFDTDDSPSYFSSLSAAMASSSMSEVLSNLGRCSSDQDSVVKTESPIETNFASLKRSLSVDSGQIGDSPSNKSVDGTGMSQYDFSGIDSAETKTTSYRQGQIPGGDQSVGRAVDRIKEKKSKKSKMEVLNETQVASEVRSPKVDLKCSVAEQVAKLHGDPISPPTTSVTSTGIKISTKDGIKITKVNEIKKQGKRSSSAGIDAAEYRRKSEAKKERKRKRAESADALENKPSVKLMSLSSSSGGLSVEKKLINVSRSTITTSMKLPMTVTSPSRTATVASVKNKSPSQGTTPPKNVSLLKHSQGGNKTVTKLIASSTKQSVSSLKSGTADVSKSTFNSANKSLKFQTKTKSSDKITPEKLKLKQLSIPSSTTITPIMSKSNAQINSSLLAVVTSVSSADSSASSKSPCISITTPPSMSITPISVSPGTPTGNAGSSNKFFPSSTASSGRNAASSGNNGNNGGKGSPVKSRKGTLSAVIDKLMVNASSSGRTSPSIEGGKGDEKKTERKDAGKSIESKKYGGGGESKDSNKAEFTVKQSSQGIKITVTKTRTNLDSSGNNKNVGKNKTSGKSSSSWTSTSSSNLKSSTGGSSSVKSGTGVHCISKKHCSSSANSSSKGSSKSGQSAFKVLVSSGGSVKSMASSSKQSSSLKGNNDPKTVNVSSKDFSKISARTDENHAKKEAKVSGSNYGSNSSGGITATNASYVQSDMADLGSVAKVGESDSEKVFRMLLSQSTSNSGSKMDNKIDGIITNTEISDAFSANPMSSGSGTKSMKGESILAVAQSIVNKQDKKQSEYNQKSPAVQNGSSVVNRINMTTNLEQSDKSADIAVDLSRSSPSSRAPTPSKNQKSSVSSKLDDDDEDGLVIDCPGTPRKTVKVCFDSSTSNDTMNLVGDIETCSTNNNESNTKQIVTKPNAPSPASHVKSPANVCTPHSEVFSNPSSVSRPSPCIIDDDLMDEALMLGN